MPLNEVCEQITSKRFGTSYFRQVTGYKQRILYCQLGKQKTLTLDFIFRMGLNSSIMTDTLI